MDVFVYFILVVMCLILSGFFSGSETALLRISKEKIDEEIEKGSRLSVMAAKELIKTPAKLLVTILLGNNVVNILGASCASALGVYYFGPQNGLIISTAAMTFFVLVFSEILPKSVAAKNPEKVGFLFALPLYLVHKISFPIHLAYEKTIEPLVKMIAGQSVNSNQTMSTAESIMKLAEGLKLRKNDGTPLPIIGSAAAAGSLFAEDILISRSEMFAIETNTSIKEAEKLLAESRFTRAIVYKESLDNVLGTLHLKDIVRLNNKAGEQVVNLESLVNPVLFVPGKMPILAVLPRMQTRLIHTAIVQDAFGVTKGMITQEDILEEIVGEIRDEFDKDELKRILKVSSNKFQVLGNVSLHDFSKETGWQLPGVKGESISEILFTELGRAPKKDDLVTFEDYLFKVQEVSGKRIARIEITKASK